MQNVMDKVPNRATGSHEGAASELAGQPSGAPAADTLDVLFERHCDRVYRLVMRMVQRPEVAEDVVSDVFLALQRNLHRLDPSRDPWPFIVTIASNRCRDLVTSKRWREPARSLETAADQTSAAQEDPLARDEREAAVRAALTRLPPLTRMIVVLRVWEDRPHGDIARIVGTHPASVRKQYSRALNELQRHLGREGIAS